VPILSQRQLKGAPLRFEIWPLPNHATEGGLGDADAPVANDERLTDGVRNLSLPETVEDELQDKQDEAMDMGEDRSSQQTESPVNGRRGRVSGMDGPASSTSSRMS